MRRIILVGMLATAIFAATCAYDVFSPEPSPFAGLVAMSVISGNLLR
ncbi:hypothetical protein J2046_005784 [Rhizobium petrolearium]|nr:hypothetical protein [Neorhizobium petrolearium]MBP1847500.1 hypothetical protein [Neorhizobium petrolearium]